MPDAYLMIWNPSQWDEEEFDEAVRETEATGSAVMRWSTGKRKSIPPGSQVFLVRLGEEPKGLVGQGTTTGEVFKAKLKHRPEAGHVVNVKWAWLSRTPRVSMGELASIASDGFSWSQQASGVLIPAHIATKAVNIARQQQNAEGRTDLQLESDQSAWAFAPYDNLDEAKRPIPVEVWRRVWSVCRDYGYLSHGYGQDDENLLASDAAFEGAELALVSSQIQIRPGDLVIARKGKGVVLGVGIAQEGDRADTSYVCAPPELEAVREQEDSPPHWAWWRHCTRVKWLENTAGLLPAYQQGWLRTIVRVTPDQFAALRPHLNKSLDTILDHAEGYKPGKHDDSEPAPDNAAFERAVLRLKHIHANRHQDQELTSLIDAKKRVYREYGQMFRIDNLDRLTADQFREFLSFKNNQHWTNLHRQGTKAANDIPKLRKVLTLLLTENKPLPERIDGVTGSGKFRIPGLAEGILTPVLHLAYPDRYGVWNKTAVDAMRTLGIWPSLRPSRFSGRNYAIVNDLLHELARAVGVDLWTLDALWWRAKDELMGGPNEETIRRTVIAVANLLKASRTRAVLLFGPAGTGKTWLAQEIAKAYPKRIRQVQFHPAYAYEDFMEGLRPKEVKGQIAYTVEPGLFKRFCTKARENPDENHLFIIDEINRGNVPKVMGELMYCLEYRGEEHSVRLPYSQADNGEPETFFIPDNVHILGTMNSSDRSVALLDVALRRRFHFVELAPDPDGKLLREVKIAGTALTAGAVLSGLNDRILPKQGRHKLIGHSYFMPDDFTTDENGVGQGSWELDALKSRWFYQVLPLLEEYFADDVKALRGVIGRGWDKPGTEKGEYFVPISPDEMGDGDFVEGLQWIASPAKAPSNGSTNEPSEDE